MTVAELIEHLVGLDPAMKVVMPSRNHPEHCEVGRVALDTVVARHGQVLLTDLLDPDGMFMAVRLMAADEER
ncbi:MAG: hypothetical protein U1C74_18540 [Phenylobacterium sp.]|nr:hypothetical protein [Phenylobacterium sp.]